MVVTFLNIYNNVNLSQKLWLHFAMFLCWISVGTSSNGPEGTDWTFLKKDNDKLDEEVQGEDAQTMETDEGKSLGKKYERRTRACAVTKFICALCSKRLNTVLNPLLAKHQLIYLLRQTIFSIICRFCKTLNLAETNASTII